jgi:hypothetical protein
VDVHVQPWAQWSTSKTPTVSPKEHARMAQPKTDQRRRGRRARACAALISARGCESMVGCATAVGAGGAGGAGVAGGAATTTGAVRATCAGDAT